MYPGSISNEVSYGLCNGSSHKGSSILEPICKNQITITQSGEHRVERLLKLIHFTDWISYYAGLLNNIDPTPVKRIQMLKSKISQ